MIALVSIGIGLLVYIVTVAVLMVRNAKRAHQQVVLENALEASRILRHALAHLEPLGAGHNLEWTNARVILEMAMHQVVFEIKTKEGIVI